MRPIIAEQLNVQESKIKENTKLKEDLGADSLDLFELVMALGGGIRRGDSVGGSGIDRDGRRCDHIFEEPRGYSIGEDSSRDIPVFKGKKTDRQEEKEEKHGKTRVSRLLGTKYPVIQGGMAWVAEYHLAAAVSNAGGLGIIGAASAPPEVVREQIREVKARTDRPFGVNVMLLNPNAPEVAKIVIEEKVPVVTTGAGSPAKFMEAWKQAGVVVIPVVASVAMAKADGAWLARTL